MSKVEFDFGPMPRSIYADLVNLPDPVYLGLTVRIFNYDDVGLYMRVDGYAAGWTFTSNDLGLLASGGNMYRNLDNFGNRAKPASAVSETVTVRLRAYTDSGYTNLKWTFERVVDIVFIKSDDGSWTQDFLNNFDDGTVQGWAVANISGSETGYPTIGVYTDYVLSAPYSLGWVTASILNVQGSSRLYKSFTTPNRNIVYAIFDVRYLNLTYAGLKNLQWTRDYPGTLLVFIGRPFDTVYAAYVPSGKWMRVVVLLPKNTAVQINIVGQHYQPDYATRSRIYVDDFKIISKD